MRVHSIPDSYLKYLQILKRNHLQFGSTICTFGFCGEYFNLLKYKWLEQERALRGRIETREGFLTGGLDIYWLKKD